MKRQASVYAIVLICFFLSGLAALLYQTVWMRYFSIAFGTSELAVVTVLVAYMGGLAAGAAVIGRFVDRLESPVRVYAWLEIGIALAAVFVPFGLKLVRELQVATMGGLAEVPSSQGLGKGFFYLATGFLILMIPTGFMGATLPLLAKGVVRSSEQIGRRIGLLYSVNTVGAIVGTVIAGFLLVPWLGLRGTVVVGVVANVTAGVLGIYAYRRSGAREALSDGGAAGVKESERKPAPSGALLPRGQAVLWFVFPLMLVSGALSFGYEVLWTRLLGHVVGGSLAAFATMLASFLGGIALGSMIASRMAKAPAPAGRGLAVAEAGAGLLSLAVYYVLPHVPAWSFAMRQAGLSQHAASAICSVAVLLPSTIFIGATFPFAVRLVTRGPSEAAAMSARVYSWNTVGAIVGAILAGFFLIPAFGFSGMIRIGVTMNLVLAVLALYLAGGGRALVFGSLAASLVFGLAFRPESPREIVRASPFLSRHSEKEAKEVYFAVGRSATVLMLEHGGQYLLRTNGMPEAVISQQGSIDTMGLDTDWMGALPSMARPETRTVLVVGFGGGGIVSGIAPGVEEIDCIELEEHVIEANRAVAANRHRDPLDDPRLNLVINDARGALALTEKQYDAIISQPSHPWTAGASHLYTREFFGIARDHLRPGGVFLQWMAAEFLDEESFRSLLATVRNVFPHQEVYLVHKTLMILASDEPLDTPNRLYRHADGGGSIHDITGGVPVEYVEELASGFFMDSTSVAAFSDGAPVSTDNDNQIAKAALRQRGFYSVDKWTAMERTLLSSFFSSNLLDRQAADPRWSLPLFLVHLTSIQSEAFRDRVMTLLAPADRHKAEGILALTRERFDDAIRELEAALSIRPDDPEIVFHLAYSYFRSIPFGNDRSELFIPPDQVGTMSPAEQRFRELAGRLPDVEREFIATIFLGARGFWPAVRQRDAVLAEVGNRRSVLSPLTSIVRVRALIEDPGDARSEEERRANGRRAIEIIDGPIRGGLLNDDLIRYRTRAAVIADDAPMVVAMFWRMARDTLVRLRHETSAAKLEAGRRSIEAFYYELFPPGVPLEDPRLAAHRAEFESLGILRGQP